MIPTRMLSKLWSLAVHEQIHIKLYNPEEQAEFVRLYSKYFHMHSGDTLDWITNKHHEKVTVDIFVSLGSVGVIWNELYSFAYSLKQFNDLVLGTNDITDY